MVQESKNTETKEENDQSQTKDNIDDIDIQGGEPEQKEKEVSDNVMHQKAKDAYSKNEDFQDKYVRVLADLENLKGDKLKKEKMLLRTRSQIIGDLLPTLDAFQIGMQEVEKDESIKNIFIGISMAYKQMENVLGEYGLELINPEGSEFDPRYHEALSYESSDEIEKGLVLQTVRTGYKLKDKLLRPASVIISQGSETN